MVIYLNLIFHLQSWMKDLLGILIFLLDSPTLDFNSVSGLDEFV
jgi:hypothetical protein